MGVLVKAPGPSHPPWEGMGGGQCGAWQGGVPRTPDPCRRTLSFFPGVPQAGCSEVGGCKALIGCLLGEGGEAAAVGGACCLALGPSLLGPILGAAWGRLRSRGLWDLTGLTHGQEPARPRGCPPAESRGDPASSFTRMGGPLPAPSKRSEHLSPPDVSSVVEKSCHIVRRGRAGVPPRRRD